MDSFKKVRGISCQLYFNHNSKDVWNVISAPNHLNLFHPFCKKNSIISWDESSHIDMLEYLQSGFHLKGMNLKLGKKTESNPMWFGKLRKLIIQLVHYLSLYIHTYFPNILRLFLIYLLN
ncbi:hypothetical protein N9L60_03100 [Flavobacteriales bacterium]|nr:hypothetical protein [Flavobacteriales bacterium]